MPSAKDHPPPLEAYAEFLRLLEETGIDYVIIGGFAVAAYARLLNVEVVSADLDLYVDEPTLEELAIRASELRAAVVKRPEPRALPVLVLNALGLEVNAFTSSPGLPAREVASRGARDFRVGALELELPLAGPLDLLRNKLALGREKDVPHIAILRQFAEAELETHWATDAAPRAKIAAAREYLGVLGLSTFPESLSGRLSPLSAPGPLNRFLVTALPVEEAKRLVADSNPVESAELSALLAARRA